MWMANCPRIDSSTYKQRIDASGRSRESASTGYRSGHDVSFQRNKRTSYGAHLGSRDAEEADAHHHTGDSDLVVPKLDAVKVLHTEGVRSDEGV